MSSSVIAFPKCSVGTVSISIDIGPACDEAQSVCLELLDRFNKRAIAATWALENPGNAGLTRQITHGRPGHEIAILAATDDWIDPQSRGEIAQRIVRPIRRAAEHGLVISSIAVLGRWRPRHVDLLTKHGMTVLRGGQHHTAGRIEPICYGMWHVPVAVHLRGGGWFANHAQLRLARTTVALAMRDCGCCHMRIDAASLAKGDAAGALRTVDRLLRDLAQVRDAGQIVIETLRDTAARLAPRRTVPAARSILRAA